MAEGREYAGRRACEFGLNMFKCYLLENRIQHGTKVSHAGSLPVGFLFDDIKNCGRNGAGKAAVRTAAGRCRGCTEVSQLLGGAEAGVENVNRPKTHCYPGLKEDLFSNSFLTELTQRNVHLYRSRDKFWGTLSLIRSPRRVHLDPGHPQFVIIRNYSADGPSSEPLYRTKTGYYDILGVSPTATQAQIKTAYYKQSFTYHPDRNSGSEKATERFSEISEAYMVLGNKALRKKYDRGLLSLSDLTARARPSTGASSGGQAEQQARSRRSVVGKDFTERVFDFDKFYKAHYGDQLQRQRDIRVRKEEMLKTKQTSLGDRKLGRMMEIGVGMLLVFAVGLLLSTRK